MGHTIELDFNIGERVKVIHPGTDKGKEGVIWRIVIYKDKVFYDLGIYREDIKDFMPYSAPFLERVEE